MKVKELIEKLQKCDPEAIAVVQSDYPDYVNFNIYETRAQRLDNCLFISEDIDNLNHVKIVVFS